ncbi:MAG: N-formylglutamate amidohydrolase [Sphingobium sp.]|uniref:N-formylglutamate amidohydrolase n=1 Tax=Sphingobium sp. TaxID=1912891 RepID=UPI0029B23E0A|nr:N-formylglutamate amidohydrolase [Sphingobium sp.]MDX3910239.1 N-formylglutamate amidohydrolase [Sphingobium sp.]
MRITDENGELLGHYDSEPAKLLNAGGRSPFLLLGDHAGNAIPRKLGNLGVSEADRQRHIAWDIGVREIGERLAARLDAAFVHQSYSRLVVDCNRDPVSAEAIVEVSDGTVVPRNALLDARAREERIGAIHAPYHRAIAKVLEDRTALGRETILISLHSFTPSMDGQSRPWEIGVLYSEGDTIFARALLQALDQAVDGPVGDNQPYQMDSTDYTVPLHAFAARLPYAELEMRQDLVGDVEGQALWSDRLVQALDVARLKAKLA